MQKAVRPQLHIDRRSEISSDYHRHGIAQVVPNHLSLFGDPFAGTVAHRFFKRLHIATGLISQYERPAGLTATIVNMHIFANEKGDYYEIADGLPQHSQQSMAPLPRP